MQSAWPILCLRTDYARVEHFLADWLERYQVELHAYVLLPNHFHLLARTLKPNVSRSLSSSCVASD